ncbi:MAG: TonB-dependent receptor [Gammaproteobacteria bacterium]|nr:TonB-dependent receptor [Gammaproteobacteria bacterium]
MKTFISITLGIATGLALLGETAAQEATLEEIIVTAQKRAQSIQDTPIAVTVLSGDAIEKLGIESSNDIADYTPGLKISPVFGAGNIPNIAIRGVGLNDFRDYHESPSAVYVDEVYKAALASLDFQVFDVERAEVLKGPQGTLFGRNATGGLVQYITRKPTDELEGYARASGGSLGELKAELAAGGPLGGPVAGRLAAIYHKNDGIHNNLNPDGTDANQTDLAAIRAQLRFDLSDSASLLVSVETARNDNDGGNPYRYAPSFVGPDGLAVIDEPNRDVVVGTSDLNDINVSGGLSLESDFTAGTARLEWSFESFDLVSVTNYQDFRKEHIQQDCDSTPAVFCVTEYESDTQQYSQELRVQGDTGSAQWDLGVFYFNLDTAGRQTLTGPIAPLFFGTPSGTTAFDTQTESWAAFGQVAFQVTDAVSLTGGLRFTNDEKDMDQTFLIGVIPGGLPYDPDTIDGLASQDDENVSFLAKISWDANDNTMVYGGVSKAFKSGTFNTGFGPVAIESYVVKPEELTSFEIGFKSNLAGGRHRLTGALFYYDYKDHQAFVYRALNQLLFNADAEVLGAELEWVGLPSDNLEISLGLGFLDTTVKDVQDAGGTIRDREMVIAPELSVNAMARYTWDLAGGSSLAAQLDGTYSSDVFYDNLNQPALKEDAYSKLNARLSWVSADERFELAAWAKNLTDEHYRIYAFDLTADLGYIQEVYHAPRTFGVTAGINF